MTNLLAWWLTIQLLGLAGLPLTRWLLRALPDRGYAFSKSLGLLLVGYLAWLLAMLGLAPFGRGLALACALAVGLGGWWLARRSGDTETRDTETRDIRVNPQIPQISSLIQHSKLNTQNFPRIIAYELIFAVAFLLLLGLRGHELETLVGPHPYGTERPMDYALFNAIRASASFPPHDPWLAGFSINYYYFGYLLMAVLSLISGVAEGAAYNLALATIFALAALGVAGVVVNLIGLSKNQELRTKNQEPGARWSVLGSWFSVLLAIVLVLGVGNLNGVLQVLAGSERVVAFDGRQLASALGQAAGGAATVQLPYPVYTRDYDFGTFDSYERADLARNFNWWWPSRSLWDRFADPANPTAPPTKAYTITEFPFFSFWLGDMHPHVMALPFGLLALALALATAARPSTPNFTQGRHGWLELALTAIVLGSLYLINSWDLPTYLLLYLGALLLPYARAAQPATAGTPGPLGALARVGWRGYVGQALPLLLAAWLLFAPFHLTFRSLVGGNGSPLGVVTWSRTTLHNFLVIFGLFLLPLLAYVLLVGRRPTTDDRQLTADHRRPTTDDDPQIAGESDQSEVASQEAEDEARHFVPALPSNTSLLRSLPWAALGALALGLAIGFPLLALLPLALYAAGLALANAERPGVAMALWAFALGCLVCFGADIVYLRDTFGNRMNTIFKFYYQVWLIWGVLAGYALWWLATNREPRTENRAHSAAAGSWFLVLGSTLVFVGLLAGALVYPALTLGKALRAGTWVGIAGITPRERTPEGRAAVDWLRANTPGDAVVLEAVGGSYDQGYSGLGYGQVSGSTGRPTVLGWPGHEEQWRGGDPAARAEIRPREADVTAIYSGADVFQAGELLRKYKVGYIYVGAAERASYTPEGLAKLGQLGDVVFQQGDVVIYRVKQ